MHHTLRRLAALLVAGAVTGLPAAAAATEPAGAPEPTGRGTARSWIRAADVYVDDGLRLGAVHSEIEATLDHRRAGVPENRVFRELAGAVVETRSARVTVPSPAWQMEVRSSQPGEAAQDTAATEIVVPGPETAGAVSASPIHDLLRTGDSGWLVDASLTPSRVRGAFQRAAGGSVQAALNVGRVRLADGLVDLHDVGPGEIRGATTTDSTTTATRGLEVGEITLLDLDALTRALGLGGLGGLLPDRLAALADRLEMGRVAGAADVSTYGSWSAAVSAVSALRAEVSELAAGALACVAMSGNVRQRVDQARAAIGQQPVDCLTARTVRDVAGDLGRILDTLAGAMRSGLQHRPLLELVDVGGNTLAESVVRPDGARSARATAWGRVGSVIVGGEDVGGFASDTADAALDHLEATIEAELGALTAPLGEGYDRLVQIDLLPVHSRDMRVEGEYLVARSDVALLTLSITPPGTVAPVVDLVPDTGPVRAGPATIDVSAADHIAAVRPAPTGAGSAGLNSAPSPNPVAPIAIVVGQLISEAEHTHPGVRFDCSGVCEVPASCSGPTCSSTKRIGGGSPSGPSGDLPRTGAPTAAAAMTGVALLAVAQRLSRWNRSLRAGWAPERRPARR